MHSEFPKINSIWKRDEKNHHFLAEKSKEEFDCIGKWLLEEKIDGTNVRVHFDPETQEILWNGRTNGAIMPGGLVKRLEEIFTLEKFEGFTAPITLYGEGVGGKIQNSHGYVEGREHTSDFILFDAKVNDQWLSVEAVSGIAERFGIRRAKVMGVFAIDDAVAMVKEGFTSFEGNFIAEGVILKTPVPLFDRRGSRVVTKLKHKDFK